MIIVIAAWECYTKNPMSGMYVHLDRWIQHLQALGTNHLVLVDEDKLKPTVQMEGFILECVDTYDEAILKFPSIPAVYMKLGMENSLINFKHPKDAIYVFGEDVKTTQFPELRKGDVELFIPMCNQEKIFYAHESAVITLYDRMLKGRM